MEILSSTVCWVTKKLKAQKLSRRGYLHDCKTVIEHAGWKANRTTTRDVEPYQFQKLRLKFRDLISVPVR